MFIRPKTSKFISLTLSTLLILGSCLPHSGATTQRAGDKPGLTSESDGDTFSAGAASAADNPIDDPSFFVRQHYHDFLNRDPDPAGLAFWINEITQCGSDTQCIEIRRINVSAAFFLSIEFQETGYLVQRFYKSAFGNTMSPNVTIPVPIVRLGEFLPDTQRIGQGVMVGIGNWEQQLETNKNAYALEFVQRQRFADAFPPAMTPEQFVDTLNQNSGGVLSQAERNQLVAELAAPGDAAQKRASVVRKVAEDADLKRNEFNRAFVLMQYYGYLRRNPDDPQDTDFRGWEFWLNKLNQFNGNFIEAEMVKAFISSIEYRARFGPQAITVSPVMGRPGQSLNVGITGQFTNFIQGTTTANFGAGISVGGAAAGAPGLVTVTSRTTATAQLTISDSAAAGVRTVVVATGPERVTLDNGFTVEPNTPALLPLVPNTGQQGQMLPVTIAGQFTNFAQGTTQARFGTGISVGNAAEGEFGPVQVTGPTSATAQIKINPAATTGDRDVTVRTGQEQVTRMGGFSVTASAPPSISNFSPMSAPVGTLVNVTGTNFTAGAGFPPQIMLQKQGGGTISAPLSSFTDNSVAFVIPTGATTGALTVTSANGQSASSATPLTVVASSDFGITATPGTAELIRGQSVAYSVSLASDSGFTQLATLNVGGLPAGATASFKPQQITAGQSSVLTVSVPPAHPLGISDLSISASSVVDGITLNRAATVQLDVRPVTTSFLGRTVVDDALETPLAGVTVTFLGRNGNGGTTNCSGQTRSDAAGNFAFTNLPASCTGEQLIRYDGLTATAPPGRYAGVDLVYNMVANQVTVSPVLVHLPRIDRAETVMVRQNAPQDQNIVFETIPNLSAIVYAGTTLTLPDGTRPDPFPFTAVQVPVDRLPDAKPPVPGMVMVFIVAFQPANTVANQPVAIFYPNSINTRPGTNMVLMTLDPRRGQMVMYGTGTVSNDGMQVIPDFDPAHPGRRFGLVHFDWHGQMPPPNPTNPSPEGSCGPQQGKPVDLSSGVEVLTETDIIVNGTRGGISLVRTYRTLAANAGPFGIGTSHNFDFRLNTNTPQSSAIINLIMPDGNQFPFVRQTNGSLINTTVPSLRGALLTTAPDGVSRLQFKDGTVFRFMPGNFLLGSVLQSISDPNNNSITLTRSPSRPAQVTEITDASGRQLRFTYDGADRITSVTDPISRTVTYLYNGQGTLASVTDAESGRTRYNYDAQNRLTRVTDTRGVVVAQNVYDANGRVIEQTRADGGKLKFEYTLVNPLEPTSPVLQTVVTDPKGFKTTYRFNPQGFLISVTDPLGQMRVLERETGTNLLLSVRGGASCNVCGAAEAGDRSFTYDSSGNLLTSKDSLGNTTTYTYESVFNRVSTITNALGHVVRFTYDERGNLVSRTDEAGKTTSTEYDPSGLPTQVTDQLGQKVTLGYDSLGNFTSVKDPLGNVASFRQDGVARIVEVVDSLGKKTGTTYDRLDRVLSRVNAKNDSVSFTYDAVGNVLSVTDQRGGKTLYTYDTMRRLETRTTPLGKVESYKYDLNGNLSEFTDRRGQKSIFEYDQLDRAVKETYADGSTVTYLYDSFSRPVMVGDTLSGEYTFKYDLAGRLTSYANRLGTVLYTYDAVGRVLRREVVGDPVVSYIYDPTGNVLGVSSSQASINFSYDAKSQLTRVERSNGVSSTYIYDPLGRVLSLTHAAGATMLNRQTYTYDAKGQRSEHRSDITAPLKTTAAVSEFDTANRLLRRGDFTYAYDDNGNRTSETGPDGSTTYSWDARNRLQSVMSPDGVSTTFTYDFQDNLISRKTTSPGVNVTENFLLDDLTNVVRQDGPGGQLSILTGRGIDQHLAVIRNGQAEFGLTDALNSTVAKTDGAGEIKGRHFYEPYGETTVAGDAYPFQFTGRVPEGNLYYQRSRFYDPRAGRFISEDTLGIAGGDVNLYRYGLNNPALFIDPHGELVWMIVGGAVIGAAVNVGITLVANQIYGRETTWQQVGSAALSGAIAGGIGAVAGPIGGSVARGLGFGATSIAARVGTAAVSAGGSALGQAVSNAVFPCYQSSVANAALFGGIGGAAATFIPVRGVSTLNQARYFAPRTFGGLFRTGNARAILGSFGVASGVGGASNFGGPFE